jgi:hypothetical protein
VFERIAGVGRAPAEPRPRDADLVQGLRGGPLLEDLLAQLQGQSTAVLALLTAECVSIEPPVR